MSDIVLFGRQDPVVNYSVLEPETHPSATESNGCANESKSGYRTLKHGKSGRFWVCKMNRRGILPRQCAYLLGSRNLCPQRANKNGCLEQDIRWDLRKLSFYLRLFSHLFELLFQRHNLSRNCIK